MGDFISLKKTLFLTENTFTIYIFFISKELIN